MSKFTTWKDAVVGAALDIDRVEGNQCVDVIKSWAQVCFPATPWSVSLGYGNAKDVFVNSNPAYWEQIANNHSDPNQLPQQGDVAVFGPSPQGGYTAIAVNPFGHVGVVESANSDGLVLVQQDGFNPEGKTFLRFRPWKYSECIGWLHPKTNLDDLPPTHIETVKPGTWYVRTAPSLDAEKREGVALGGQKYETSIVENGWRKISFRGAEGFVGPKAW